MTPAKSHPLAGTLWLRSWATWIAATRPHLLVPAWAGAGTGAAWIALGAGLSPPVGDWRFWSIGGAWSLALAAIHLLNLVTDQLTDLLNGKNRFWNGHPPAKSIAVAAGSLAALALMLAWLAGMPALLCVAATLALGCLYSLPPARCSARGGWDLLVHLIGYGMVAPLTGASMVWGQALPQSATLILAGLWPAVAILLPWVGAGFLWTTLPDRPGDLLAGKRTFAVRWGARWTARLAIWSVWCAIGVGWLLAVLRSDGWVPAGKLTPMPILWSKWLLAGGNTVIAGFALLACAPGRRRRRTICWHWGVLLAVSGAALAGVLHWPWLALAYLGWWAVIRGLIRITGPARWVASRQRPSAPRHGRHPPSPAPSVLAGNARGDP